VSDNLTALAEAAGQALVQAMVSDGWSTVRGRVVRLFGRGDHQREVQVAAQLDASREGLQKGGSDVGVTASRWQGRVERNGQELWIAGPA
jgi:hypothetical protein